MDSRNRRPAADMLAGRATAWPEAASPVASLFVRLLRCADLVQTRTAAIVGARGLTVSEFETLAALRSAPAPHEGTPEAIRGSLLITSGGLSKVLATLTARGLVERLPAAGDRREKPARLTTEGRARIESAMADVLAADEALVGGLSPEERKRLTGLVERLLAQAEPPVPAGKDQDP